MYVDIFMYSYIHTHTHTHICICMCTHPEPSTLNPPIQASFSGAVAGDAFYLRALHVYI